MDLDIIEIPLKGSDSVLEIPIDRLPETASELYDILSQEEAPLSCYLPIAIAYNQKKSIDETIYIIKQGLSSTNPVDQREKLALINCLAYLYIKKARMPGKDDHSSHLDHKETHLELATALFNEADRIDIYEKTTWLGKGLLLFSRKNFDEAMNQFNAVLEDNPNNLSALILTGHIFFFREQYSQALSLYQKVLRLIPFKKPDVRINIGLCFFKLNFLQEARKAFERALQLDPDNSIAKLLLALLRFNELKDQLTKDKSMSDTESKSTLEEIFFLIKDLSNNDFSHPILNNFLSDYYFYRHDYEKVASLCANSLSFHNHPEIQAESHFQIARVHHQLGQFEDAFLHYGKAVSCNQNHIPSHHGLAQMYIQKNDLSKAALIIEKLLEKNPKNLYLLSVLALIFAQVKDQRNKALHYLEHIQKLSVDDQQSMIDPYVHIELGQIVQETDWDKAIKYYQRVIKIPHIDPLLKAKVENNIGSLLHLQGKLSQALTYYQNSLNECQNYMNQEAIDLKDLELDTIFTTTSFNIARVYEDMSQIDKSEEIYQKLIEQHPAYLEPYLRLGVICHQQGKYTQAIEWFQEALSIEEKDRLTLSLFGITQEAIKELRISRKTFEKILRDIDRHDLYALTFLGNLYLRFARSEPKKEMRESHYKRAVEFFEKVIKLDDKNLYAANGIGILFSERGKYEEAYGIFTRIRESTKENYESALNLAHVSYELGSFRNAMTLYEFCIRKFNIARNKDVYLSLARAQYSLAKLEKDFKLMRQALTSAQKALKLDPRDKGILYNIGLIHQSYAHLVSERTIEIQDVRDLELALHGLETSQSLFKLLSDIPKTVPVAFDREMANQREKHVESLRNLVTKRLIDQRNSEKRRQEQMEEVRRRRELEKQRQKELELEKQKLEDERQREIELSRQRILEKLKEDNASYNVDENSIIDDSDLAALKKEKKRRKKKETTEVEGENPEEPSKKKRFKSKATIESSGEE